MQPSNAHMEVRAMCMRGGEGHSRRIRRVAKRARVRMISKRRRLSHSSTSLNLSSAPLTTCNGWGNSTYRYSPGKGGRTQILPVQRNTSVKQQRGGAQMHSFPREYLYLPVQHSTRDRLQRFHLTALALLQPSCTH